MDVAKKRKILIWVALAFAVVGLIASLYSVQTHYQGAGHSFCSINSTFDCDVVNQSTYSEFLGIPVALIGVGGYVFMLLTIWAYRTSKNDVLIDIIGAAALVGLAFSGYLTYIEAQVLYTWCLVCLTSQLAMLVITVAVLWLRAIDKQPTKFQHE